MSIPAPQVFESMVCADVHGDTCSSLAAGHQISAIRARVASTTASKWRDGIVTHTPAGRWIGIDPIYQDSGQTGTIWVWHHADLSSTLKLGEPVAVHELYGALAIGGRRISILLAPR